MSKNCIECSKKLTFRNSYKFEGKEVCKDCLHKLKLKKEKSIDENQVIPKRFYMPLSKTTFTFPQLCPCCLVPSEKTYAVACNSLYHTYTYSLDIPICNACDKHIRKYLGIKILAFVIIGWFVLVSLSLLMIGGYLFALYFGIAIFLIVMYHRLKNKWIRNNSGHVVINKKPISISSTFDDEYKESILFEFENSEYAELFSKMNIGKFVNK